MEGVGTIFESYRDGILEDDDEVAIVHGPAEAGFLAGSEAMVNIRQTLRKSGATSVSFHRSCGEPWKGSPKSCFIRIGVIELLLRSASECGLPEAELAGFQEWLPEGRVNQKREDALAMLRLIRQR